MNKKIYLRIGKGGRSGIKVEASLKANREPLHLINGFNKKTYLPTTLIALNLTIPDNFFDAISAELQLKIQQAENAIEVRQLLERTRR